MWPIFPNFTFGKYIFQNQKTSKRMTDSTEPDRMLILLDVKYKTESQLLTQTQHHDPNTVKLTSTLARKAFSSDSESSLLMSIHPADRNREAKMLATSCCLCNGSWEVSGIPRALSEGESVLTAVFKSLYVPDDRMIAWNALNSRSRSSPFKSTPPEQRVYASSPIIFGDKWRGGRERNS